jgi:hypothetical protein
MIVKEFVGICADRNMEVIIRDEYCHPIAKGNVMELFMSDREEILTREVYCFFCNNKKLYISLTEPRR